MFFCYQAFQDFYLQHFVYRKDEKITEKFMTLYDGIEISLLKMVYKSLYNLKDKWYDHLSNNITYTRQSQAGRLPSL